MHKKIGFIKLEIVMCKHAKHYHEHANSFSRAFFRDSVCCHFEKINEKNTEKTQMAVIYTKHKLTIMLYKPFMLNMVWKSTERFLLIRVLKVWKFEMENV